MLVAVAIFFGIAVKETVAQDVTPQIVVQHPTTIDELISFYASHYKVSASQMRNTIKCESSFNTKAVGDGGHSIGLSQINLPSHVTISRSQAENPRFAIEFMAQEFSKGHQKIWTCYRNLYT